MSSITDSAVLAAALDGLDGRLKEGLAQLDAQIDAKELELKALRTERSTIVRLLRAIDPDSVPTKPGPKPGPKPRSTTESWSPSVSPEKVDQLEDWLRAHPNDDGWSAANIEKHKDFAKLPMSRATTSNALMKLALEGRARLDHTNAGTGAKFYKLTNP